MNKYLLGFVVGYELPNVVGDNKFYVEENVSRYKTVKGQRIWYNEKQTKVFRNPDMARERAEAGQKESDEKHPSLGTQWFWRAYAYETDIPKHARGLPTWEPTDELWHWINPRTQVVEVLPDPAVLTQALSKTR